MRKTQTAAGQNDTTRFPMRLAVRTPAAAAGAAYGQIRSTNNARGLYVARVKIVVATAVAGSFGLIYAASVGTSSTSQLGENVESALDGDPAAYGTIDTAWTVAPTISGTPKYLERVTLPATIGTVYEFMPFEQTKLLSLDTATGGGPNGLLLWNFGAGAGPAVDLTIDWLELSQ